MKSMKKIVILILGFLLAGAIANAQKAVPVPVPMSPPEKNTKDDFDYIKAEIARLLIENKKLESEYESLRHQVDALKVKAHEKEREAEKQAVVDEDYVEERSHQKELNALKAVYGGTEKLRNEIMVKKSRTGYLSTELVDLEEKQRPWKLKRSDLEFLKRELELDIQLLHYEMDARDQRLQDGVNHLQEAIQDNLMAEREILDVIDEVEQGSLYDPKRLISLFEENESLQLKVMRLAHETEFQVRENEILDKKRVLVGQSKGETLNQKRQEKQALMDEVKYLQHQVDTLHLSLDQSLKEKSRREDMLKDFVFLQQENDKLRSQITQIQSHLNPTP